MAHIANQFARSKRYNVRLVASRIQIVPEWPPVACKLYPLANSHLFFQFACDWAATRIQFVCNWRPVACKAVSFKNEETIKKSENLCDICTSWGLSINTMHGPIQSRETVP
jgi:hypothetical protein